MPVRSSVAPAAPEDLCPADGASARLRDVVLRRVWLPDRAYRAMPLVYLVLGLACLAGAMLLPGPGFLLPYLVLMGTAGLHAAWLVRRARRRSASRPTG